MRAYVLKALLVKEFRRHVANRGGIALCLLLVVAALLLSVFNPGTGAGGSGGGSLIDGVHRCMVLYQTETPLIQHLEKNIPADLKPHLIFEPINSQYLQTLVNYPPGTGAIQIRERDGTLKVDIMHPPGDPGAMAGYEVWLWRAMHDALHAQAVQQLQASGKDASQLIGRDKTDDEQWAIKDSYRRLALDYDRLRPTDRTTALPQPEVNRQGLGAKPLDLRSAICTGMVVFCLYFFCVYLLPTMTCEERERGVLLAQALSPASPSEILAAKFLFYPTIGMGMAAVLAGIYKPELLSTLFFWLALVALGAGFLGIGMTVATLAKTQREAFMGSMCYLMSVSLILFICQQNSIPLIPYLAIEFHGPRVIHAAVSENVQWGHWGNLVGAAGLGMMWMVLAGWLFRRRGWQ
ncbi:MAG: ABC transporter permease [Fimbriiglobus sp.]